MHKWVNQYTKNPRYSVYSKLLQDDSVIAYVRPKLRKGTGLLFIFNNLEVSSESEDSSLWAIIWRQEIGAGPSH